MLIEKLFWPSATPQADRFGCFTRTAADDLKELGYGSGTTEEDEEEKDETDGDSEQLEESESSQETAEGDVEETDETDYKKRFIGSQKQHLEDKKRIEELEKSLTRLSSIEQDLQRLKTQPTQTATQPATRGGLNKDAFWHEINSISASDPEAKRKVVDKWVDAIKTEAQNAVYESRTVARQEMQSAEQHRVQKAQAEQATMEALKAVGFNEAQLPKAFAEVERDVNHLIATDPGWFERTPAADHFKILANGVKQRRDEWAKEAAVKANQDHEKKAGGSIGGSRQSSPSKKPSSAGVKEMTFSQARERDYEERKARMSAQVRRRVA